MGDSISEGLDVHFAGLERLVGCCSYLGHFSEVKRTGVSVEIEDLSDTLLGNEEQASIEILCLSEPDVAGLEPGDQPGINTVIGGSVVVTNGAVRH